MARNIIRIDRESLSDLRIYLDRVQHIENGAVRLIGTGGVLAVYSSVLYPASLLDRSTPTVLGLRTFAAHFEENFDRTVSLSTLKQRAETALDISSAPAITTNDIPTALNSSEHTSGTEQIPGEPSTSGDISWRDILLPEAVSTVTWAGISPPRGGWLARGELAAELLEDIAKQGMAELAHASPVSPGEAMLRKIRAEIWGAQHNFSGIPPLPKAAAFAAVSLGFLYPLEPVRHFSAEDWQRLSTSYGHVLIRSRAEPQPQPQ